MLKINPKKNFSSLPATGRKDTRAERKEKNHEERESKRIVARVAIEVYQFPGWWRS